MFCERIGRSCFCENLTNPYFLYAGQFFKNNSVIDVCMDGWMEDGWMYGCGWMYECMDECMDLNDLLQRSFRLFTPQIQLM